MDTDTISTETLEPKHSFEIVADDAGARASLFKKLMEAAAAMGALEKDGRNSYHGYDYVTDSQVTNEVRTAISEAGLAFFASKKGSGRRLTIQGRKQDLYFCQFEYVLGDTETGAYAVVSWEGVGADSSDKGVNKAATSGLKYWMLKSFMLPTDNADPDGHNGNGHNGNSRGRSHNRRGGNGNGGNGHSRVKVDNPVSAFWMKVNEMTGEGKRFPDKGAAKAFVQKHDGDFEAALNALN